MKATYLLGYTSVFSVLPPLALSFRCKADDSFVIHLRWLLSISLFADVLHIVLGNLGFNTIYIGNIYLAIQFAVVLLIINSATEKSYQKIIFPAIILFGFGEILDTIFFTGLFEFHSNLNAIGCIIVIYFSLLFFSSLLTNLPITNIERLPLFWIVIGILFYYAGNLFIFILNKFVLALGSDVHQVYWVIIHNLLNITKNILFAIGLWTKLKAAKS